MTASDQPQPNPTDRVEPKHPCPFKVGDVVEMKGQDVYMTVEGHLAHPGTGLWIIAVVWFDANAQVQRAHFDEDLLEIYEPFPINTDIGHA